MRMNEGTLVIYHYFLNQFNEKHLILSNNITAHLSTIVRFYIVNFVKNCYHLYFLKVKCYHREYP